MKEPKSSSYTPDYSVENPGLISMYDRNENESRAIENTAASNRREERTNIRLDRNSAAEQRIVKHEELGSICRPLNSGWLSNNEYLHRNCACSSALEGLWARGRIHGYRYGAWCCLSGVYNHKIGTLGHHPVMY